ncbi:hypothetical protein [Allorhodopirellula heiligendammensis]|uniref:Uncharacterized protein n=1 Tax=Allorhodopirellula heiligendammensis TaxID=2714739 RepID=A0A5C6C9H7_9BACT|nr:hypothetical protein [Allorhodopirellula heiligendammensis]TWU19419.1 hypothetical protein Poly21_15920 [Allorhodopirellula heiligendammensis]
MPSLSDVEWIFVVLVLLYAWETLVWARSGVAVFVSRHGSFQNRHPAIRLTGNDHGSLLLSGVLPSDMTLLCHEVPISMSARGIAAFVPASPTSNDRPTRSGDVFTWQQLTNCRARERDVRSGEQLICTMGSTVMADHFAGVLRELACLSEQARIDQIDQFYCGLFNTDEISQRLDRLRALTPPIRRCAHLMLAWIGPIGMLLYYGVLPLKVDNQTTATYIVVLFALWWTTVALVWRAHCCLFQDDRIGRFKLIACSLLSPAVPLRAIDYLSRQLLAKSLLHPLAVSATIDSPDRLRDFAHRVVRDFVYPLAPDLPEESLDPALGIAILEDCRVDQRERITQFLAAHNIAFEESLKPPRAEDEYSLSYCPRCWQQFERDNAVCDRCGGRATLPLRV